MIIKTIYNTGTKVLVIKRGKPTLKEISKHFPIKV